MIIRLALALTFVGTTSAVLFTQALSPKGGGSGPVSIAMRDTTEAAVLFADGRVVTIDTVRGQLGNTVYRIPSGFDAIDMSAGRVTNQTVMCFTVNRQSSSGLSSSYLLQRFDDKHEIWAYMPAPGVYVGVALDSGKGVAYVTNASNQVVYRVLIGQEKGAVREVATLSRAKQIGALAVDSPGERLFVADVGSQQMIVLALDGGKTHYISADSIVDPRALIWRSTDKRVYIADSGRERVWSLDPANGRVQAAFRDDQFKAPAGLTLTANGVLWLADESARAAFELSTTDQRVTRIISFKKSSRASD